jgi:predicted Zn-dependent peptidase
VILDELDRVRQEGISAAELAAAKTNYEGSLARSFETVLSLASIIGIEELLHRIVPFAESVARIREVTTAEVQRTAAEVLSLDRYAVAVIGRRWQDA